MTNISLLEMGKVKKRGVREAIIEILSREFPLSIRKIYNQVKKEYHLDVTYQAAFKTIKEMLQDGLIEKTDMEYKLNMNWIKQLENEINIIKKNYSNSSKEPAYQADDNKRFDNFISVLGPKIKEYIGNDKACVVGISGFGIRYAVALWKYLTRIGVDSSIVELNKIALVRDDKINFKKEDFENRKVIIADGAIFMGNNYRLSMSKIKPLKNKFKIKDIRYTVGFDSLGLADFSLEKK